MTDSLWPSACPRCRARLSTLDRLALQARRLGTVSSVLSGKGVPDRRDLRKCEWCDKPNSAPKVDD